MSISKSRTFDSLTTKPSDPAYQINRLSRMIHEDADRHGLWDDFREAMRRFEDREDGVIGSDSARYKMWGNGIALPCAADVLGRIAKEETCNT